MRHLSQDNDGIGIVDESLKRGKRPFPRNSERGLAPRYIAGRVDAHKRGSTIRATVAVTGARRTTVSGNWSTRSQCFFRGAPLVLLLSSLAFAQRVVIIAPVQSSLLLSAFVHSLLAISEASCTFPLAQHYQW